MYLRPDYYAETENTVKILIADLIIEVENGADYETAKQEAYTRIYQSVNPAYNPDIDKAGDFCYWDIPPVDSTHRQEGRTPKAAFAKQKCWVFAYASTEIIKKCGVKSRANQLKITK